MRRIILVIAAMAACGAVQLAAQQPHPGSPLENLLGQHRHAKPVAPDAPHIPQAALDATSLGSPLVLDKGWRVGITANQAAADPDFDDSGWALRDAQESFADVADEDHPAGAPEGDRDSGIPKDHQRPFAWFRLHVKLAPHHGPLVLLLELPVSQTTSSGIGSTGPGVDVFANGKQIPPEGPHADSPEYYQQISRVYDLKLAPDETSLTLAIRTVYVPFGLGAYTSFFGTRSLRLGNREDLERSLELWSVHSLFERLPRLVYSILLTVLAFFLLALYFTQKGHTEYLWLALYELLQAPIAFVELAGSSARMDLLLYGAVCLQLLLISAYLYFEFLVAFLALRRRWYINLLRYAAPVLAGIGPGLIMVGHGSHIVSQKVIGIALVLAILVSLLWIIGWLLFIFITLIAATLRRNFEAGLLLLPLVLSFGGLIELVLSASMSDWGGHSYRSPLTIQAGPVPIHVASIADFAGILVIVLIIFVRFLRVQHDQERASSELAAARSVQELMIPQERLKTPGFEVDSIYNPANEVGGDFYHLQTADDGGLLVVIGDVAGKGLKAAMNVSMLMGALRGTPERGPARILEALNRVLVGGDSFTTCQAAWFGANGELVLANAGHLPPYLNSQEISLPGGLPLGVLPDVSYPEVRLYLHPGDRILLMSDGVVEARQPSGELFGFDRVHNLSNQSAFYIADAAKEFGQEDDITVLTVRRLAQAMAA
ncbi:MAG: PP2C family protein-serine/threonine phosphatase [Terracidiphilus sp.]